MSETCKKCGKKLKPSKCPSCDTFFKVTKKGLQLLDEYRRQEGLASRTEALDRLLKNALPRRTS